MGTVQIGLSRVGPEILKKGEPVEEPNDKEEPFWNKPWDKFIEHIIK